MSNAIKRCFMNELSADSSLNDLSSLAIEERKAEIINYYQNEYEIDSSYFTDDYWLNAGRFHYQSLQTLLGDTSSDWYKNKIIPFKCNIDESKLPIIQLQCTQSEKSLGELTGWQGDLRIIITAKSSEDMTLGENIKARIIKRLDRTSIPTYITIPNGILGLNYSQKRAQSGIDEYDNIILTYFVTAQFLEI